jgi:hypothetical protein
VTRPDWPPVPRPSARIRHTARCPRLDPVLETVRVDPTGQARVVLVCSHCDGTDMVWRLEHPAGPDDGAAT